MRSTGFGGGGRGGRGGGGGRGGFGAGPAIWVFDDSTKQVHSVYQTRGGTGSLAVQHDVLNWGADGRLVFVSEIDGWQHLYSVPMSGGTAELLTPGECEYETMSFTADHKNILFNS